MRITKYFIEGLIGRFAQKTQRHLTRHSDTILSIKFNLHTNSPDPIRPPAYATPFSPQV